MTNQIPEGNVLLRKLTEKSYIQFGMDRLKVGYIIENNPKLLRWVYFNYEKISFTEEILKKIYISDEFYIKKPGKNSSMGRKLEAKLTQKGSGKLGKLSPGEIYSGINLQTMVKNRKWKSLKDNIK